MTTNFDWAETMLARAGLPTSMNNVNNVVRWMAAEEPPEFWFHSWDPLNANNLLAGGQEYFPNLDEAAISTASIIRQGNMAGIWAALAAQAPLAAFSAAVVASPWAASHYGGNPDHIAQIPLPPVVQSPGSPLPPVPPPPVPVPTPPEEDMQVAIYAVNSTGGAFVLPAGCESKTGVPGPAGAPLRNSGLYVIMDGQQGRPQLPDSFLNAIPNA